MHSRLPVWATWSVADPLFREVPEAIDVSEIREIVAPTPWSRDTAPRAVSTESNCNGRTILDRSIVRGFLSPATNKRTDEYGGSLENRSRILLQMVSAVHDAIGPDLALGVRICGEELIEGGTKVEDAVEVAKFVEATDQVAVPPTPVEALYMALSADPVLSERRVPVPTFRGDIRRGYLESMALLFAVVPVRGGELLAGGAEAVAEADGRARILGGGAGLDSAERFVQLASIAEPLEASVGATRVITDRGWIDHSRQIGMTGVVVDPKLGSGSVPAFLAHELNTAQALGLMKVAPASTTQRAQSTLEALRRLDEGRRERLSVDLPAVISAKGSFATLRRTGLAATLTSGSHEVETRLSPLVTSAATGGGEDAESALEPPHLRPWRPRPRALGASSGAAALARIVELTGALVDRTPQRTVALDPADAASAIIDQLVEWGYISSTGEADGATGSS